jgi:hypothetical protein
MRRAQALRSGQAGQSGLAERLIASGHLIGGAGRGVGPAALEWLQPVRPADLEWFHAADVAHPYLSHVTVPPVAP